MKAGALGSDWSEVTATPWRQSSALRVTRPPQSRAATAGDAAFVRASNASERTDRASGAGMLFIFTNMGAVGRAQYRTDAWEALRSGGARGRVRPSPVRRSPVRQLG